VSAKSVIQKRWAPTLIGMRDENGVRMVSESCPVTHALCTGVQTLRRLSVQGRENVHVSVDAHMVPVAGRDGVIYGATLLLHDASSQITLEERVQMLHEKATRDPLTKIANRAEFDRVHAKFVETHLERGLPCSLIICDIDHFKKVNDRFGHQAGDDVLVIFAALLQRSCRPGDLVARYGGEEFVLLCADCDNATATERAELACRELAEIPHHQLGGRAITASFGVTEIQAGDTPETMLRRADRALLQAKQSGRNRVVQLGTGIPCHRTRDRRRSWWRWFQPAPPRQLLQQVLITAVPLQVTSEKLRGFILDHHAEINRVEEDTVQLQIAAQYSAPTRRSSDRPVVFNVSLRFAEIQMEVTEGSDTTALRTLIEVVVRPVKNRDRRRADAVERSRQLLTSLKSYFMAHDYRGSFPQDHRRGEKGVLDTARHLLSRSPRC
jgi:diguanylate cyclase (GGDEF)-like protein